MKSEELREKYNNTLEYIESLNNAKSILGLERIKKLLALFDNPQDKLNIVHIAGTNGKGSTTTMLSKIYLQAGYKVGSFLSPYVIDFRERVQYNCEFIEKDILCDIVDKVKEKLEKFGYELTHFELITVIAFLYYEMKKCDIVFLEVGLGGRLDSTNVISHSLVSIITKIDYDHMAILGNTLAAIATEKCGIIKPKGNVVLYPDQEQEVLEVVANTCKEKQNRLFIPDESKLTILNSDVFHLEIVYQGKQYKIGLSGRYQINNVLTVLTAVEVLADLGYHCCYEDVYKAIQDTSFAGRFEVLSSSPTIIVDGAHNKSGVQVFIQSMKSVKLTPKIAIVSILKDKDIEEMSKEFSECFDHIIIVPINHVRGTSLEYLKDKIGRYNKKVETIVDYEQAIERAKKGAGKDGVIGIFGSLYLVSDMRNIILNKGSIK